MYQKNEEWLEIIFRGKKIKLNKYEELSWGLNGNEIKPEFVEMTLKFLIDSNCFLNWDLIDFWEWNFNKPKLRIESVF